MKTYKDYGAPTNTTPGNEGDLYIDMNTGEVYRCYGDKTEGKDQGFVTVYAKERSNTTYAWSLVGTSAPGPGGDHECTGVSSWNDLLDRPFYEYEEEYTVESTKTVTEEMTVEHDGTIDENALLVMEMPMEDNMVLSAYFVYASDAIVPSVEAALGATISVLGEDGVVRDNALSQEGIAELIIHETKEDGGEIITINGQPLFVSVTADNVTHNYEALGVGDITFPKKGLYLLSMLVKNADGEVVGTFGACTKYVGQLTHDVTVTETKTRTVIEPIDHKFLPYGSDEYEEIHYEEVSKEVTEEMTIEHDGTIDENALLIVEMPGEDLTMAAYFVRVSDATIPTKEDAVGAIYTATSINDAPIEGVVREEGVIVLELEGGTIIACGESADELAICSVSADNLTFTAGVQSVTFPKKGLYFMVTTVTTNGETASGGVAKYVGNLHHTVTETITHSETKIKTIDPKFLPEPLAYEKSEVVTEEMTIEWDGVVGDRPYVEATDPSGELGTIQYVHISDAVIPTAKIDGTRTVELTVSGEVQTQPLEGNYASEQGSCILIGDVFTISVPEDNTVYEGGVMDGVVFPKKGLYFSKIDSMSMYMSKYTDVLTGTTTTVKPIDPKFLPDTIAPKELILTSSTEGSTKQFKITVADDGTVSAVEVTA